MTAYVNDTHRVRAGLSRPTWLSRTNVGNVLLPRPHTSFVGPPPASPPSPLAGYGGHLVVSGGCES